MWPDIGSGQVAGELLCAWVDEVSGNSGTVSFARSTDGGASWSLPTPVTVSNDRIFPALVSTPTAIVCVYEDYESQTRGTLVHPLSSPSLDGGLTWSPEIAAGPPAYHGAGFPPAIAVSPGGTTVVFAVGTSRMVLATSTDDGATWYDPR